MDSTDQLLLHVTLQAQRAGHQVTLRADGGWVVIDHEGCPLRMPLEEAITYMVDVVGVDPETEAGGAMPIRQGNWPAGTT